MQQGTNVAALLDRMHPVSVSKMMAFGTLAGGFILSSRPGKRLFANATQVHAEV